MTEVHGYCGDGWEAVRDTFVGNFDDGNELGASAMVTVDGEAVVDIWAGDADEAGRPWADDTIVNVYSTTKTMAGLCMLMLADRGELDFSAPVAEYWPEFAANGKAEVRVRHVMSHTAGLSGIEQPIVVDDLYDWDKITGLLAAQAPWWEPGTAAGYHAITQGYLQGEIVRRITGRTIGTFFREEVAEPLGADFHIGLAAEHDDRVADLVPPASLGMELGDVEPSSIAYRTFANSALTGLEPRTRAWRGAEIPAAGGTGNARSVGRVHSALACGGAVDGVSLLSPAGVELVLEEQFSGDDLVMGMPMRYGMGFGLNSETIPISPNQRAFFWGGWGGSLAVIDLDPRMTVSYVMNKMAPDLLGDLRGGRIVLAAHVAKLSGA